MSATDTTRFSLEAAEDAGRIIREKCEVIMAAAEVIAGRVAEVAVLGQASREWVDRMAELADGIDGIHMHDGLSLLVDALLGTTAIYDAKERLESLHDAATGRDERTARFGPSVPEQLEALAWQALDEKAAAEGLPLVDMVARDVIWPDGVEVTAGDEAAPVMGPLERSADR